MRHVLGDQCPSGGNLAFARGTVLVGDLLEVVDVVEVDVLQFTAGAFDVARNSDVDEEQWPLPTTMTVQGLRSRKIFSASSTATLPMEVEPRVMPVCVRMCFAPAKAFWNSRLSAMPVAPAVCAAW